MVATIYEVAKKSGFSIGTVSRVLNGVPLHAESTCEKVLQVVDELNYSALAEHAGLMTVRQPLEEIGYRAVERLVARLENSNSQPQRLSLQPDLVVRKSWGAKKTKF